MQLQLQGTREATKATTDPREYSITTLLQLTWGVIYDTYYIFAVFAKGSPMRFLVALAVFVSSSPCHSSTMILLERRVVLPLLLSICLFTILALRLLPNDDALWKLRLLDDEQLVALQAKGQDPALVYGNIASPLELTSTSLSSPSVPSNQLPTSSKKDASPKLAPSRQQTLLNLRPDDWLPPSPLSESDRFLSYTAHSGFHNQR